MELTLTFFSSKVGPSIIFTFPNKLSDEIDKEILENMMDIQKRNGFVEMETDEMNSANFIFEINSTWARGKKESLMLSYIADKTNQDLSPFERVFKKYQIKFANTPNIFKGLYIEEDNQNPEIMKNFNLIREILIECYEECRKLEENLKIGNIFILGLDKAGKTDLINYIRSHDSFFTKEKIPGNAVIRVVYENTQLDIFDVGGSKKINDYWQENPDKPEAIIYLFDSTGNSGDINKSINEFKEIIEFFFGENAEVMLNKETPILILGNKVDQIKQFDERKFKELFDLNTLNLNFRLSGVSIDKNIGIIENLKWLVEEFLKIT